MKLVTGNSNLKLADGISKYVGLELSNCDVKRFADNEIFVEMKENVRGEDVFVIQSTSYPANDNLMELLIIIDTLRRASAKRITAVVPYFGYARQDRKVVPRTSISAKVVANLITNAGAGRVVTVEENPRLCGWGAEISSIIAEECFYDLDMPIVRITTPHIPLASADELEDVMIPSVSRIFDTISQEVD